MAETSSKGEFVVGVDLGGTKILAGVFKNSLECIGSAKLSTKSQRGVDAVVERIARCVQDAVDEADLNLKHVAGVGIGAPGAVDFAEGKVIFAPNMECWKDVPLKWTSRNCWACRCSWRTTATSARWAFMPRNSSPNPGVLSASSSARASVAG